MSMGAVRVLMRHAHELPAAPQDRLPAGHLAYFINDTVGALLERAMATDEAEGGCAWRPSAGPANAWSNASARPTRSAIAATTTTTAARTGRPAPWRALQARKSAPIQLLVALGPEGKAYAKIHAQQYPHTEATAAKHVHQTCRGQPDASVLPTHTFGKFPPRRFLESLRVLWTFAQRRVRHPENSSLPGLLLALKLHVCKYNIDSAHRHNQR